MIYVVNVELHILAGSSWQKRKSDYVCFLLYRNCRGSSPLLPDTIRSGTINSLSSSSPPYVLPSPLLQNGSHQFSHLPAGFSINVQNWFHQLQTHLACLIFKSASLT